MTTQHTPALWFPARITTKHLNIVPVGGGYRCNIVGGDDGTVVAIVCGRTERECEANTHLIAASPEMLAVLELAIGVLVTAFGEPNNNPLEHGLAAAAIVSIRAIIAKAEGR